MEIETTRQFLARVEPEVARICAPPALNRATTEEFTTRPLPGVNCPKQPSPHQRAMRCRCCDSLTTGTTRHHLIPRAVGGVGTQTVRLCQPCHRAIHILPNVAIKLMTQAQQFVFIKAERAGNP